MHKIEIDMLKEEISKVKHNISDKVILREGLAEKIKKPCVKCGKQKPN